MRGNVSRGILRALAHGVPAACAAILALVQAAPVYAAMESASYAIPASVVSGGGGTSKSAGYLLTDTIGEPFTLGSPGSASYLARGGFVRVAAALKAQSGTEATYLLTITRSGTGVGSIEPGAGSVIWSGNTGSADFPEGASVTLAAIAENGSVFTGWGGGCSGAETSCTMMMDGPVEVVASFADVAPPVMVLSSLPDLAVTGNGVLNLVGTVTDNVGIGEVTISGTPVPLQADGSFSLAFPLREGANLIEIEATDLAGNRDTDSRTIILDSMVPLLTVSTLADGSFTKEAILNVAGSATDANALASLAVNGEEVEVAADGSFSTALSLVEGANTVEVVATDAAGNQTSDSRTITHDPTAPALTVTTPADNSKTNVEFAQVTGTFGDPNLGTITVVLNDGSPRLADLDGTAFSLPVLLAPGLNTIHVTATDLAGNTSSVKRTVIYLSQAPSLAISDPNQDITTFQESLTLRGTASQELMAVTVEVAMDGQTYRPPVVDGAFEHALTFGGEKTYRVTVTATDEAGNSTSVVRNIRYARSLWGDVNRDAVVDVADALKALQIAVGAAELADEALLYGDVAPLVGGKPAPDGRINVGDALIILKKVVGAVEF